MARSNGVRHREDGPAVIEGKEIQQWWREGRLHREDGPAVTYEDGTHEWYLNGVLVDERKVAVFKKGS